MRTCIKNIRADRKIFEIASGSINVPMAEISPVPNIKPNPGKNLEITVDGTVYFRLPIRTPLITEKSDLLEEIKKFAGPHLQPGDILYVSEKVVAVTQGRIINMNDVHPSKLARFLARRVHNNYGTKDFKGFGHGTPTAMQLLIEEAGYPRVIFAAGVAAVTRPIGIKGAFYYLCGKLAKSVDCPMSFSILEYAHYAKRAPKDPNGVARAIRAAFGCETVILDANYIGAFSLGKTTRSISEKFIGKLFADNPAGQSSEMTPFLIVRKK
jgi:F420-0:Gamma-glutamyl ligase